MMRLIVPQKIEFLSHSIEETDDVDGAEWSASATYAKDAKVRYEHVSYTSLAANNKGNDPSKTWSGDNAKWKKVDATMPYRMCDEYVETQTRAKTGEHLSFCVKFDRADAFALFNLDGYDLRAHVYDLESDTPDEPVWPDEWDFWQDLSKISLWEYIYNPIVSAWTLVEDISAYSLYEYNYAPIVGRNRCYFSGIPIQIRGKLCIDIDPGDSSLTAGLGQIVIGRMFEIGWTEYDAELGFTDFSRKTTDEFGRTTLVRRSSSNTMSLPIYLHPDQGDYIKQVLDSARGIPCAWIGSNFDNDYRALTLYGALEDYRLVYAGPNEMRLSLEIQGLI